MGRAERAYYMIAVAVIAAALVHIAYLLSGYAMAPDAPRADTRELIIQGGYLSWQAADACGGTADRAECARVLREVNANPYGVRVLEDGSILPE